MSYSAVINCTYSALHQVEYDEEVRKDRGDWNIGVRAGGNGCNLTLVGNCVYSTMTGLVWWDKSRPHTYVARGNMFEGGGEAEVGRGGVEVSRDDRDVDAGKTGPELVDEYWQEWEGMSREERERVWQEEFVAGKQVEGLIAKLKADADGDAGVGEDGEEWDALWEEERGEWVKRREHLEDRMRNYDYLDQWARDMQEMLTEWGDAGEAGDSGDIPEWNSQSAPVEQIAHS